MIPDTKNGLPAMACVSAMQKAIRRGLESEAMEFAVELMHTCKAFHSMVCNRLKSSAMKTSTRSPHRRWCRSSRHHSRNRGSATASRSAKPG